MSSKIINNRHFFRDLQGIDQFSEIVDIRQYRPLPDDWLVIATDIRGSTEAISNGKYRAVNMAGACAIAAIINDFPDLEIPFVFGGDGVTIAMPDVGRDHILGLLKYCKEAVNSSFGLELAAGCQSMAQIRKDGRDIKIGKYLLSDHVSQAIFWGDGVDYIKEIIKQPENNLSLVQMVEGNFSGLECRWNEIPSEKDEVISVIIKSIIENDVERSEFYKQCFQMIEKIYGDESDYAPVKEEGMTLSIKPKSLRGEATIRSYPATLVKKAVYFFKLYYTQLAGWYLMKKKISTKHTDWGDYKTDFVKNADFKKFSDGLKLVLSGTTDQRIRLRSYLKAQYRKGNLVFGTHSSPASMTTCFVTDYQKMHVHFIDGTNGGYASASVELKEQLKQLNTQKSKINSSV
ncbi:DUF3095 family protein [Rhodohalobacter sp. 8-1]|uniref:DUF3095 family protein n=1 Tax=Rhodohalobacter sp. 8-1 TaxID=3131972 RepID=UPI0030EC63D6